MKKLVLQANELDFESIYTSILVEEIYVFSGKEWIETIREHAYELIDGLDISVYCINKNGIVLDCNKYCYQLFGLNKREEVIGLNTYQPNDLKIDTSIKQINDRVMRENITIETEEMIYDLTTNKNRYFLTTKSPLRNKKGEIIGVKGYSKDITQFKQALEQILKEQMLHEQEREQRQAITVYAGGMSHDLKNVIHKGGLAVEMSELGLRRLQNKYRLPAYAINEVWEHLMVVRQSHEDLKNLIEHSNLLMQQATIDESKMVLTKISVSKLLYKAVSNFAEDVENGLIVINLAQDSEIQMDEIAFMRIFINLIDNAKRQITLKKKGKIYLSGAYLNPEKPGLGYCFEIKDTAGGVTQALIDQIFKNYTTQKVEGTGLGLQGVVQLVNQLQAELSVHLVDRDCIAFRLIFP